MSVVASVEGPHPAWLSAALGARGDGRGGREPRRHRPDRHLLPARLGPATRAPATVLAKLPAADPAARAAGEPVPHRGPVLPGALPTVAVRAPGCTTRRSPTTPATSCCSWRTSRPPSGDQVAGRRPEQVEGRGRELAGLHGPRWCDPRLADVGRTLASTGRGRPAGRALRPGRVFVAHLAGPSPARGRRDRALPPGGDRGVGARPERAVPASCTATTGSTTCSSRPRAPRAWSSTGRPGSAWRCPHGTSPTSSPPGPSPTTGAATRRTLVAAYHQALAGHGVTSYPDQCWTTTASPSSRSRSWRSSAGERRAHRARRPHVRGDDRPLLRGDPRPRDAGPGLSPVSRAAGPSTFLGSPRGPGQGRGEVPHRRR